MALRRGNRANTPPDPDHLEIRLVAAENLPIVQGDQPSAVVTIKVGSEERNSEVAIHTSDPVFDPR